MTLNKISFFQVPSTLQFKGARNLIEEKNVDLYNMEVSPKNEVP
jgi:hypothetical protein